MQPLILYGVPFSQPVRAVMWMLLLKQTPFEMVLTNPGSKGEQGTRHPDYLEMNPGGTIPCIKEPSTGFTLGEAHAIMTYLSRINGWSDLYPEDDRQRAMVDWYLHYHHRTVRDGSVGLVAPRIRKDLNIPEALQQNAVRNLTRALTALESWWLRDSRFLVGDSLTLADLAAYVEIGQLQPQFTNVFDFSPFPRIQRWLADMTEVDYHDEVHTVLSELGDISAEEPSMETIKYANKRALQVLNEILAELGSP